MLFTGQIKLLTALMIVLVIVVLMGCASGPVGTPDSLSPTPVTPTATAGPSVSSTDTPTLMDIMIAETRHFVGDPSAPVTIIEFGDFQ
jgi:PBP1b-binding outer membrane lipoprotein LpoB